MVDEWIQDTRLNHCTARSGATGYEARDAVQGLACLNAVKGPSAYFITIALSMSRLPGVQRV